MAFETLRQDQVPSYVHFPEYDAVDRQEAVPSLSPTVVHDWLAQAFARACPDGGRVGLHRLEVPCVRARLVSQSLGESFPLLARPDGPQVASIPIESEAGQLWLVAPIEGSIIEPPLTYRISNHYGNLIVDITMRWSWWFEPDHAEFDNLRSALQWLAAHGWRYGPTGGGGSDLYGLREH